MTYSFTQLSQYLRCPRGYRHRYLDGWREKDTRAAMIFGRCFEQALAALFRRQDPAAVLFREWGAYRNAPLEYTNGDTWDRMVHQGVALLEQFARDNRVRVRQPRRNLQIKLLRKLTGGNEFVAYVDAIGFLDDSRCLLEWKTTASRYPEEPSGLLALDPQLSCYSWMSGIAEVAVVVFIRKRVPEIQDLRTTITDAQREEFGQLVEHVAGLIQGGCFLPHPGIRFPNNGCVSCPYLGLCLEKPELVESKLVRVEGAEALDWINELEA